MCGLRRSPVCRCDHCMGYFFFPLDSAYHRFRGHPVRELPDEEVVLWINGNLLNLLLVEVIGRIFGERRYLTIAFVTFNRTILLTMPTIAHGITPAIAATLLSILVEIRLIKNQLVESVVHLTLLSET